MASFAHPSKAISVRPAWPDEGPALSALAMEAKAHWGYDADFMELCRPELTVTRNTIGRERVRAAEAAGELVGFSWLRIDERKAWVENLFVRPAFIGRGVGHLLIRELLDYTRRHGIRLVHVEADPNATGFYESEGFSLCGEVPSGSIPGRMLPLMELRF